MSEHSRLWRFLRNRLIAIAVFWLYWLGTIHIWEMDVFGHGLYVDALLAAIATEVGILVVAVLVVVGAKLFARWRYSHWLELEDVDGIDFEEVGP